MRVSAFIYDDVSITPDRQIGFHSHPKWELSYVMTGEGLRTIGDRTEAISRGEIVLIPPGLRHGWDFDPTKTDSNGNISNISVFFTSGTLDSLHGLFPELSEALTTIKSQTEAFFYSGEAYEHIKELLLSMRGLSPVNRLSLMIRLLAAISNMTDGRVIGHNNSLSRSEQRCEKIRVFCSCNYARNISLEDIARHTGMNKSAFCTFMRNHFGMTLSHYVNNIRLEHAKEKLSDRDCSISEIAMDCGFANVSYFNRLFKAKYGHAPKSSRS